MQVNVCIYKPWNYKRTQERGGEGKREREKYRQRWVNNRISVKKTGRRLLEMDGYTVGKDMRGKKGGSIKNKFQILTHTHVNMALVRLWYIYMIKYYTASIEHIIQK